MSVAELKAATTSVTEKPKDFPSMFTAWLPEIRRALPKHLNADRMSRIALTAFRRTPKLAECDPRSVFAAVIQAAQLGLEPDMLGRSYLIPYAQNKKTDKGWTKTMECQFVPGWKGLVDLMNRSGQGSAWTGAIREGDFFEYQLGDSPFLKHRPTGDDGTITHVYAIGRAKGSDWPVIEVWSMPAIWKHRDRYNKVGERHYSYANPEMYARKVVLLQVLKYMPCSPELATAMALNDSAEIGEQHIDLKDAIAGTWESAGDGEVIDHDTGEVQGAPAATAGAPAAATQMTVIDAIAKLASFSDMEVMSLWSDAEVPVEIRQDERFTKKFRERMDEIKASAGGKAKK